MRVFITGASGAIGSAVVEALVAARHRVLGLVRSDEAAALVERLGATAVRGEIGEPSSWRDQAATCEALVHAALERGPDGETKDRRALEAMLDVARRADQDRSVVYTSDVLVLGDTRGGIATEDSPTNPTAALAWRPAHEELCLAFATERVATAVIRPGMVYGGAQGGHLAGAFAAGARGEAPTMIGDGTNRWCFIHREDLAQLYRLVVEKRARGVFHGVDGSAVRVIDIFSRAAHLAGGRLPPFMIPVEGARQNMGPAADALTLDQTVTAPRSRALGWTPARPPVADNLRAAFAEWHASASVPRAARPSSPR